MCILNSTKSYFNYLDARDRYPVWLWDAIFAARLLENRALGAVVLVLVLAYSLVSDALAADRCPGTSYTLLAGT